MNKLLYLTFVLRHRKQDVRDDPDWKKIKEIFIDQDMLFVKTMLTHNEYKNVYRPLYHLIHFKEPYNGWKVKYKNQIIVIPLYVLDFYLELPWQWIEFGIEINRRDQSIKFNIMHIPILQMILEQKHQHGLLLNDEAYNHLCIIMIENLKKGQNARL
jgi:hypothetical protein